MGIDSRGGVAHAAWMLALAAAAVAAAGTPNETIVRDVYLMGTRARLVAWAADRSTGLQHIETAVRVLESTEAELSTWREDSLVSRINRQPIDRAIQLPPALCGTFAALVEWQAATAGAFDPGIGRLTDAWGIHAGGRVPSEAELQAARAASGLQHFTFDRANCVVTRQVEAALDVGGFGKGHALDRVLSALGAASWLIDLGGQVSVHGTAPDEGGWEIAIAHPRERDREFLQLRLREGSLSTSAGSERDVTVDGRRVGHILDPRTGHPALFDGSVSVWHAHALVADILSTALYVMGPLDGLRFAESRGLAACFLVPDKEGRVRTLMTAAFRLLLS